MKKTAAVDAKGLTLSVYRNAEYTTDFTLGGLTGRHNAVTLVGFQTPDDEDEDRAFYPLTGMHVTRLPRGCEVFAPTEQAPAVILRYSAALDTRAPRQMHLAPVDAGPRRGMAGGNFAGTSDSRLPELMEQLTGYRQHIISVHDRFEG